MDTYGQLWTISTSTTTTTTTTTTATASTTATTAITATTVTVITVWGPRAGIIILPMAKLQCEFRILYCKLIEFSDLG